MPIIILTITMSGSLPTGITAKYMSGDYPMQNIKMVGENDYILEACDGFKIKPAKKLDIRILQVETGVTFVSAGSKFFLWMLYGIVQNLPWA